MFDNAKQDEGRGFLWAVGVVLVLTWITLGFMGAKYSFGRDPQVKNLHTKVCDNSVDGTC